MEYRGIKLDDNINFYKKDGSVFKRIKNSLDRLADLLEVNGHKILNTYIDEQTKVLIDFNCEHHPHEINPNNYKNGKGCTKCGHITTSEKKSKRAENKFLLLVKSNCHSMISEYKNNKTKVLIDFKCGHKPCWIMVSNYKKGKRCAVCSGNSKEQSKKDLMSLIEINGHLILSEYKGNNKKVLIDFQCGHNPHLIVPNHYKSGSGCPACSESKGEKKIRNWLDENEIVYESQKEFYKLVGLGGGNLSYDFHIINKNILIEYQGQFHDGNGNYYMKENLEYQQEHDRRKKEYAVLNEIELLEIWYWDYDNIEKILKNRLI